MKAADFNNVSKNKTKKYNIKIDFQSYIRYYMKDFNNSINYMIDTFCNFNNIQYYFKENIYFI